MSCVTLDTQFRLLDGNVGWGVAPNDVAQLVCGIDGHNDAIGLRLKESYEYGISAELLSRFVMPLWIARGCAPCEWYLVYRQPKSAHGRRRAPLLRRRDPCTGDWLDMLPHLAGSNRLVDPVSVAVDGPRLAVADAGDDRHGPWLFMWSIPDGRLTALVPVEHAGPVAFAPWGELLLALNRKAGGVLRFDRAGVPVGTFDSSFAIARFGRGKDWVEQEDSGDVRDGLTVRLDHADFSWDQSGKDCAVWAATPRNANDGTFELWRLTPQGYTQGTLPTGACCETSRLIASTVQQYPLPTTRRFLEKTFRPTDLVAVSHDEGSFCLEEPGPDRMLVMRCFRRDGRAATQQEVVPPPPQPQPLRFGQLLTSPINGQVSVKRRHLSVSQKASP